MNKPNDTPITPLLLVAPHSESTERFTDCVVSYDLGTSVLLVSYTRTGDVFEEMRTLKGQDDQAVAEYLLQRARQSPSRILSLLR